MVFTTRFAHGGRNPRNGFENELVTLRGIQKNSRPRAGPSNQPSDTEHRVRTDRVNSGAVTVRIDGQLHHIGLGRPLNGTRIILLITGAPIGGPHRPYGPRKTKKPEPP